MKKLGVALVSFLLILTIGATTVDAASEPMYRVFVDGKLATSDAIVRSGATLVPFKDVLAALGFNVHYNGPTKSLTARKSGLALQMTVGVKRAFLNGKVTALPVAPQIYGSAAYIPVRFVGKSMNCSVEMDASDRAIYIDSTAFVGDTLPAAPLPATPGKLQAPASAEPYSNSVNPSEGDLTAQRITGPNGSGAANAGMNGGQGGAGRTNQGVFLTHDRVIDGAAGLLAGINGKSSAPAAGSPFSPAAPASPSGPQQPARGESLQEVGADIASALNKSVTRIPTAAGDIRIKPWRSALLDDGTIGIIARMDDINYAQYLDHYPDIEEGVRQWAQSALGDATHTYYAGYKIFISLYYSGTFSSYPGSFDTLDIEQTADGFTVTHFFMGVSIDGGVTVHLAS